MVKKHYPRIKPGRRPLIQFGLAMFFSAIAFGIAIAILTPLFRWLPAVFVLFAVEPQSLFSMILVLIVGLLFLILGIRLAFLCSWRTESMYQWIKPGGYHWKYRGILAAAEARDVRRLMRIPAWAHKAGLTREVFVRNDKHFDVDTQQERIVPVHEIIYPRAESVTFPSKVPGMEGRGPRVTVTMQDGYRTGLMSMEPSVKSNKLFNERYRAGHIQRAGRLKHAIRISDTTVQILSRPEPSVQPRAAPQTLTEPHSVAVPTQECRTTLFYDYKRAVLGERYQDDHPVRNWLMYKIVAKAENKDCDKIALRDELEQVRASGFQASPDSMNSFWTTYKRAIHIWYGETFTLGHPTNNVERLLEQYDAGAYPEVNQLLAQFATFAHVRGNFLLVPVYNDPQTGKPGRDTNFNLVRNRTKSDYWDLTLEGIKGGEFRAFFGDNPVAPQFDIASMPGGFSDYIARNHLEAYMGADGEVAPLWPGHLNQGAKYLPQTKADVIEFSKNVCAAIEQRTNALPEGMTKS